MKTVFLFSGQGSQYYHMGGKLFEQDADFRNHMHALDEIVKANGGPSVVEALYHPRYKLFDPFLSLQLTHPAIFMVEYALSKVLEKQGILPDYVLGCSLGEFTAATLAGVLSAEQALKLILKQAEIVEKSCPAGGMIAVLHHLEVYQGNPALRNNGTVASLNSPAQFVLAGESENMKRAKSFMKDNEILHQELMVSYGFHSPAIDPAKAAYTAWLEKQTFNPPSIPFLSAAAGNRLHALPKDHFWDVVRKPVAYMAAIEALENAAGREEDLMYIDLGPSGSLANLIKYNVPAGSRSKGFQVMSPFQQEYKKLEEIKKCHPGRREVTIRVPVKNQPLTAYVFPGQGSQRKGMGEDLFDVFPELTHRASEVLGYSIRELCVDNPNRTLNLTQYTQPALYVVNALSYLKLKRETGLLPSFVAGHSLGEFNAIFAAGGFDFETGLRLVQKRGALMAQMKEGGMAAVKGLSAGEIQDVMARHGLHEMDMANYNTRNQVVLSGPKDLIARSGPAFESAGATLYFPLNVSGAFHSRYMLPAKEEFERFLRQFSFSPLQIPVVSNVEAAFYTDYKAKALLADQLIKPVKWTESVTFLMEKGEVAFREVGPGDVLTKLVWRIQQDLREVVQ